MKGHFSNAITIASILIILLFILFLINQTAQAVQLANTINPLLGRVVLFGLLAIYAGCAGALAILYFRMPAPLEPPAEDDPSAYAEYLRQLGRRLADNPLLTDAKGISPPFTQRHDIEKALAILHQKANQVMQNAAATVFVSTAISQSGRLDALMVLLAQTRLITQIATIYWHRPGPRQMLRLYANVGLTTFLVREIEDLDLAEQIEPIVTAALSGSVAGAVPGVGVAASVLTASILEGTANAFLTLRVGAITRRYCSPLTRLERGLVRRSASAEAAAMLGGIVLKSAGAVARAITNAARQAGTQTVHAVADNVAKGKRGLAGRVRKRASSLSVPPAADETGVETSSPAKT